MGKNLEKSNSENFINEKNRKPKEKLWNCVGQQKQRKNNIAKSTISKIENFLA